MEASRLLRGSAAVGAAILPWHGNPCDAYLNPNIVTVGRAWPIFAGEYELLAGGRATGRLSSIAKAGNEGYMLPEQVWDDSPPSGKPGLPSGEGTFSATPLAWTHAQYVRLAWSIQAGEPVEQPSIVACRYTDRCP